MLILEKVNKIGKSVVTLIRAKREKTIVTSIRNKKGFYRYSKDNKGELYANIFCNLYQMDKVLKRYK